MGPRALFLARSPSRVHSCQTPGALSVLVTRDSVHRAERQPLAATRWDLTSVTLEERSQWKRMWTAQSPEIGCGVSSQRRRAVGPAGRISCSGRALPRCSPCDGSFSCTYTAVYFSVCGLHFTAEKNHELWRGQTWDGALVPPLHRGDLGEGANLWSFRDDKLSPEQTCTCNYITVVIPGIQCSELYCHKWDLL